MTRRYTALGGAAIALCLSSVLRSQTPAPAQGGTPLTFEAARDRANVANPTIVAARLQRAVDIAGIDVAKERPNPDLLFEAARDTPRDSLSMSFPIELGGKRTRRVDVAKATVAATEAEIDQTIFETLNDVRRAYFQAAANERLLTLAEETRALALRARDTAKTRLTSGDVAQLDVSRADLTLASADEDVIDARGELSASRADLNALLGQPAGMTLTLSTDLESGVAPTLDGAMADATRGNRELLALDKRIAEQVAKVNLAKAQRTPDLTIGAGVTFNAQPDFAVGWRANAGITLPLFTSHKAGVAVEEAELARLRAQREATLARIAGAVASSLAHVAAARDRMTHFHDVTSPLIADVERMEQAGYAAGQTPLSELINAYQQTRDIRRAGVTASLDFQNALADLERAMGVQIR